MASETLSLFPSPVSSNPPKSCLRQAAHAHHTVHDSSSPTISSKTSPPIELRGLALQLTPQPGKTVLVESASTTIKHSLFCDPVTTQTTSRMGSSSRSPSSTGTPSRDKRRPPGAIRKASAGTISSETRSVLSGSPTLVRSNSGQSSGQRTMSSPVRSIFPEYNSSLPLSQQPYYPKEALQRPRLQRRDDSAVYFARSDSPVSTLPTAGLSQLQALWNAAHGQTAPNLHTDKIRLAMHCDDIGAGCTAKEIRFGSLEGRTLYSVSTTDSSNEITIRRHHPARTAILPIAQVDLAASDEKKVTYTSIFSQQAALAALEAAASTHKATSIAQYDPRASSPQAAQLAFDAVSDAKAQESCQLVRMPLEPNSFGQEEHKYELRHPHLGVFTISIEGEIDILKKDTSKPRNGKLSLHHPYASPIKSSSTPPELLSLDMSTEKLDVDVSAFKELDSKYILDSCICAIISVAMLESDNNTENPEPQDPEPAFAAPPQSSTSKNETSEKKKVGAWSRALKRKEKFPAPPSTEKQKKEKLPRLTRGVLYLLGFSFEAVVWLLGLGVKVLSKVIVCCSAVVSRV